MSGGKSYRGIDIFRAVAAVLVVTIHTSPLLCFSEAADFILTRIIARTAVPFFFMTSGFFVISRYSKGCGKLLSFVKKTALVYEAAILLYLPINFYNGYFSQKNLLPNIVRDIVFDGTLYHLWYLPAAIIGAAIACGFVRKLGYGKALAAAVILYVIGLFGDSYFGLSEQISAIRYLYARIFELFDYTRNGVFMAPVFFVLGGMFRDGLIRFKKSAAVCGLALSLVLMTAEALLLRRLGFPRFDSMYICLLPCSVFLFGTLLCVRGRRAKWLRDASLTVYIIHPMAIVFVRMAAKILGLRAILVDNSLVHFAVVCAVSVTAAAAAGLLKKKKRGEGNSPKERAWIELDLDNLAHNAEALRAAMPAGCELMAVVKAAAYGHGAFETVVCLERIGVRAFAVATADEGIKLRKYGICGEILVLGYTSPERARELKKYCLTQTLVSYEHALAMNSAGVRLRAHLKLDTGMHRLGFDCADKEKLLEVFCMKNLEISGIFTHLSAADSLAEDDVCFTRLQIERFDYAVDGLRAAGVNVQRTHIQSSYGLLNYPEIRADYVRAGVALYGVLSAKGETRLRLDLRPVLSLRSRVVQIRKVKSGESVGYGRAFTAEKDCTIAIISIGYADGLPRSISGGGIVIGGQRAEIVGRVCMDQIAVDVTGIAGVQVGTEVTVIGEGILAEEVAQSAGSITNELLSRIGSRVRCVVKEENA